MLNIMAMLVHHKQQMFYANVLRNALGWTFRVISHPSISSYKDISTYLPKLLGYHPCMDNLIGFGRHKYFKVPPDLLTLTESSTVTDGMLYRYCVMDDNSYCPILLVKLMAMKNVVVLQVTDVEIQTFYSKCTITNEDIVKSMNSRQLRGLAEQLYSEFKQLKLELELENPFKVEAEADLDLVPEDKICLPQQALVTKDKDGAQHLVLTPTNGADTLPHITIWTVIEDPGVVTKQQQMLLQRCWLDNKYPTNRIKWVMQSSGGKPDWWTWGGDSMNFQEEFVEPSTGFVVVWKLNYYYLPHSTYAKVKLMLDNNTVNSVGSYIVGEHYIESNNGYEIKPDDGLSMESVVCYRKSRHPLIGEKLDWKGWVSTHMNIPFNYNAIKVNFGKDNGNPDHKLRVIKLLDDEMRSFMNRLYRIMNLV